MNPSDQLKTEIDFLKKTANTQQEDASNPAHSVWVEASAGTGKTKVLSDRVLRLLLEGAEPSKILCLTYTKAAAVEMKTRINARLSKWTVMNEEDLTQDLNNLYYKKDVFKRHPDLTNTARKLFAKVLDESDSVKIETIHAFCTEVFSQILLK